MELLREDKMPRIPVKQTGFRKHQVADNRIGSDGAGMVNSAIAKAAGQVTDFTIDIMKKRKRANDTDYAFKSYMSDFAETSRFEQDLKQEEGANPETYALKMREFTDERMKAGVKAAPSDEAKTMYEQRALPLFTKSQIDAENYQNTEKAKYFFESKQQTVDASANALLDNPNYVKARDLQIQLKEDFETDVDVFGETVAKEALTRNNNKLAMGVLDGLEAQGRYGEAIALLKDNEAEGKITNDLEPKQKAQLLKRYNRGLESKKNEGNAEVRRQTSDAFAAALNGNLDHTSIGALEAKIDTSGFKPEEKKRLQDAVKIAKTISPVFNEMSQQPVSEWKSPKDIVGSLPGNFNEAQRSRAGAAIAQQQMRHMKSRESDGAQYILDNYPGVAKQQEALDGEALVDSTMMKQKELGVRNIRPIPKSRINFFVQSVENATPEDAALALEQVSQKFGKHSGAVISQMVADGKMKSDYLLVAGLPNPASRANIIDNIRREPEFDEIIKNNQEYKSQKSNLPTEMASNSEFMRLSGALRASDPSRSAFVAGISNQVNIEAKKLISTGENASNAVEKAVATVFENNYYVVDSGPVSSVIPRAVNDGDNGYVKMDEDVIDTFVESHSESDYFSQADIPIPADYKNLFVDKSTAEITEMFHDDLEKNSFWDLGSDQRSMILKTRSSATGRIVAVQDSNKESIRFDLVDMHNTPDIFQAEASRGFFDKLFKRNEVNAKKNK